MAKYEVLVDSVIGSGLVKAGSIIEYDGVSEGKPGSNLRLLRGKAGPVKTAKVEDVGDESGEDDGAGSGDEASGE